ncbi:MAG TPA: flagellar motor protein MotB [Idiomarina baltica]|jgi:chemotaxis protein MotB|uniref:Flagellar motor protein MotB n=1 Tax=Idiomarina baltica TaxID=190892 RepID=A0A348WLC3_9GAMM|nr:MULTISPECIES: flagellar motor protein MotB [Idiomarina]MAF74960.1 flagellar motor protein MotB [Idiomarinaceae bacterium]MEC8925994.1 flagellar motor protein MotB [Pseudomonadota bacterium]KXS36312.1 MAG: chemotaxis protein MotB [Idiomarina sp. T82-3]MBR37182.1 flagellar motor protein MotB [Idiomarina sp.]HAE90277.1 flagellar motor protein MotB [Idiomarina sp.]|tara:strand:- start:2486 stop:3415 length:930 start_codon:yes stop_codon:yes gene_type:complete
MAAADDQEECRCPPPGLPMWMATFADLMTLLMCFFVLLLAFSEMDVLKFKQIAGSMKYALGVQNKIEVKDIPKGTSIIAQEFRPGRPEPTPIETIQQQTVEMTQQTLEFQDGESDFAGGKQVERGGQQADSEEDKKAADGSESDPAVEQQVKELMERIREQLSDNIKAGSLELEQLGQQIIIRIKENGSFPEGSAFLQPQFKPVIREVAQALKDIPGEITISGHTDNQPLVSEMYTSKWDLSAKRAVAVAEEMTTVDGFDQSRLVTMGYADTKPIVPNNSASNRALNRRVDIAIMQGKAKESDPVDVID